ncbi:MAG TPA: hypothetical protein VIO11_01835, partial [Candidatus Methanoperedens sp.]
MVPDGFPNASACMKKDSKSYGDSNNIISRRRFLILLGILFGIILAGLSYLKLIGIKAINKFRIRSIEQAPVFDPEVWKLIIDGLVNKPINISYDEL